MEKPQIPIELSENSFQVLPVNIPVSAGIFTIGFPVPVPKITRKVFDLVELGEAIEDFFDIVVSETRKNEPTIPWEDLKAELGLE